MTVLPTDVYSVDAVRRIDANAIDGAGIPGYTLMCRAGASALAVIRHYHPRATRVAVVCGPGNNGGDGFVLARLARAAGIEVSVVALVDPDSLTGDAATARQAFEEEGGQIRRWSGTLDERATVVVDALLGSGLTRPLTGAFGEVVSAMNAHPGSIVAIDIPSGIHGDEGTAMGPAVAADVTVTFVGLKTGLFTGAGIQHCGIVEYDGLGIPASCYEGVAPRLRRLDAAFVGHRLPRRRRDAHKGDHGHVLVVGGGAGMPGASLLCGWAALRTGAGRVTLATDGEHAPAVAAARPELMVRAVTDGEALEPLLGAVDVVAFGPGLGDSPWAKSLYTAVAAAAKPSVWDADALNLLATVGGRSQTRVITPHPGEAGRLLDSSAHAVQATRVESLARLQASYGGTVVLKGAGTLVTGADGTPRICTDGNPGMAAPGMGDVLTGVIAALLAQGLPAEDAAAVGVQVHAAAGDAAAGSGERGLLAGDVIDELRAAVNP